MNMSWRTSIEECLTVRLAVEGNTKFPSLRQVMIIRWKILFCFLMISMIQKYY